MRKFLLVAPILVVIGAVGTYLYLQGKEYTFRFAEATLQEKMAQRLPLRKRYLLIFEVVLDNPRLTLIESSNRVRTGLDVTLNLKIGDQPRPLGGELDVSGGIRYEAVDGQFFLTDPVIENLHVQGVPSKYTDGVNSALTKAIAAYYSDRPIYTLKGSDVKTATAKLLLKNVVVEDRVLIVTLGI